jgi:hypothetical protein
MHFWRDSKLLSGWSGAPGDRMRALAQIRRESLFHLCSMCHARFTTHLDRDRHKARFHRQFH